MRGAGRRGTAILGLGALAALAGAVVSPAAEPGVDRSVSCEPVEPVEVDDLRAGLVWLAEPDLAAAARILAGRDGVFAPFRGLPAASEPPPAAEATDPRPAEPIRIVLLRDLACLEALGISDPGADWVAGLAVPGERIVAVRVELAGPAIAGVAAVLRHELAHLALHRASAGRAPRWLQEGYAQFAAGSWDWSEAWRLRWTFVRASGERLREIGLSVPRDPEGARLAYQLSFTAVQTLWELAGERGVSAFVASLAEGDDTDRAFRRVFGITEGQFVERWRASVASRYGVLYTLSRVAVFWIFVSLLLVWAGIRRRRIKRERLQALREADRREAAAFGREHPIGFRFDGPGSETES